MTKMINIEDAFDEISSIGMKIQMQQLLIRNNFKCTTQKNNPVFLLINQNLLTMKTKNPYHRQQTWEVELGETSILIFETYRKKN